MYDAKERLVQLAGGMAVERDVYGIVERIRAYDPHLDVKYLDPANSNASVGDAPYIIFERCPDGIERQVMRVWTLDASVLERIYDCDTQKKDILKVLDRNNNAVRLGAKRKFREENEDVRDVLTHVLKSMKTRYSFELDNKKITVDDSPGTPYKVEMKD